jgi:hypothetical protein
MMESGERESGAPHVLVEAGLSGPEGHGSVGSTFWFGTVEVAFVCEREWRMDKAFYSREMGVEPQHTKFLDAFQTGHRYMGCASLEFEQRCWS